MTRKNTRLTEADLLNMVKEKPHLQKLVAQQIFRNREVKEYIPVPRDEKELLEDQIQALYFEWVYHPDNILLMPSIDLIHSVPNARKVNKFTGFIFKATGTRKGFPDLCIPVSRKPFFNFYIEVKTWKAYQMKNHNCSVEQLEWHKKLREYGHRVDIMWSLSEMISETKNYLGY